MNHFIQIVKSDLSRLCKPAFGSFGNPSLRAFFKWYFFPNNSTFPFVFWLRTFQFCRKNKLLKWSVGLLVYWQYRRLSFKYGIFPANCRIGNGLLIMHGSGVFMNCKQIGDNFTVYQNVTLGNAGKSNSNSLDIPIVENNVTVFTGSVVVGNVTLHDGCIVAANSFVNKDVEANTMVAGCPAKVVKRW